MFTKLLDRAIARRHPLKTADEIRAEIQAEHNLIGHGLAQRFSRGNVNIQRGQFLTREDLARAKKNPAAKK